MPDCGWSPPLRVYSATVCTETYAGYGVYAVSAIDGSIVHKHSRRLPPSLDQTLEQAEQAADDYVRAYFFGKSYELVSKQSNEQNYAIALWLARKAVYD